MVAMVSSCSATWTGPGWAKMVRIAAAAISALPLGTWACTLRRKCTRHLCQDDPISIAARSPACASEITSCTPDRPRFFRPSSQPPAPPARPDHPVADLSKEPIQCRPVVGGLVDEYERAA